MPALAHAIISAQRRQVDAAGSPPRSSTCSSTWPPPAWSGCPGFDALGMRGSASGRLRLTGVRVPQDRLVARRQVGDPDARGGIAQTWFAVCIGAVYLGIGEGARQRDPLVDRPQARDGSTAVADLPTIQVRIGRMDAVLRAARIVLLDVARRESPSTADIALAKLVATNAAVIATDEALRIAGGPGYLAGPLERAFRDARAGLINPPLEDVALGGFGRALVQAERDRSGVA